MISLEAALAVIEKPEIADLKTNAFTPKDGVNLILQRAEITKDQPAYRAAMKAWKSGDDAPFLDLVHSVGIDLLVRRAAAFIYLEYLRLRPIFETTSPNSVADIGCGYAMFDLFLAKEFGSTVHLIDLESNETRHFGFKPEGAAYSSLKVAKAFLTDNGVPENSITTLNPEKDDVDALRDLDFAFSFISCGYHYPWYTYRKLFEEGLSAQGKIIIDLRARTLAELLPDLSEIGYIRFLEKSAFDTANRIIIAKAA